MSADPVSGVPGTLAEDITGVLSRTPKNHEFSAAIVIAEHFRSDVVIIRPASFRTPDLDVDGTKWEVKSPMGSGTESHLFAIHIS